MGQVIGFSHCKELGSVSSTPDSTPPCTDGGNEESDFPELITAREWSEDEEGPEDDDGGLSSPSIWGTPRQNSFELTFSYIAFSEGEGSSRRDSGRRRTGGRGRRGSPHRVDTVETLLPPDSPTVEWDPQAFLSGEGELEVEQEPTENIQRTLETPRPDSEDVPVKDSEDIPGKDSEDIPDKDSEDIPDKHTGTLGEEEEISGSQTFSITESFQNQSLHGSELIMETTSLFQTEDSSHSRPPQTALNTQEELSRERWLSALDLSDGQMVHIHIAVMDLIYWKDTERTGMVFTGLVVGLLSLFQLSIITVVSTLSLAIMCFTITVRIYCTVLHALQLRDGAHPFKSYLDMNIGLVGENAEHYMQRAIILICSAVNTMKRLVFVGNLFDSLKFLLLMYVVTYLGALCNGLTLLIIGVIAVFSVPLFYTRHQDKVDAILAKIQAHADNIKDILTRLAQGGGPPPDPTPGGAKPKDQ